jgi:O-antigen ligase
MIVFSEKSNARSLNFFVILIIANLFVQVILAKPRPGLSRYEVISAVLLIFTFVLFFLKQMVSEKPFQFVMRSSVCLFVALFILMASVLNVVIAYENDIHMLGWLKAGYGYNGLLLLLVVFEEIRSDRTLEHMWIGIIAVIIVSIGFDLMTWASDADFNIGSTRQIERIFREFVPNLSTLIVGIGIVMGLAWQWRKSSIGFKGAGIVIWILIAIRTILSGSRFVVSFIFGAFGILISLILIARNSDKFAASWKFVKITIVMVGLLSMIVVVMNNRSRNFVLLNFKHRFSRIQYAISKRIAEMKAAVELGNENPVFGRGFGSKIYFYRPGVGFKEYDHVHNIFAQLYKDGGVSLVFIYLMIFVAFFKGFLGDFRRFTDPFHSMVLAGFFIGICGLLSHGLFSTMLRKASTNYYLGILMGGCLCVGRICLDKEVKKRSMVRREENKCS